jgi:hypothetical protein
MADGGPYKIGQRFGPYELEAYLGAGAFKSVYRAHNLGSEAPEPVVALVAEALAYATRPVPYA